ncbi:hypothetical protein [Paenibacillus glucanolyticus]|uniref:hypothetical protein n=1 Tax=Paenibacillus glucanolyticus TaxID=59843 RepID=UPI000A54080D|nr:hypothetical protein [Paenibacillus glucanolyticus]
MMLTSHNIIFTHRAYALGPAGRFRESRSRAGHTQHSLGVVNTGTLCEIDEKM